MYTGEITENYIFGLEQLPVRGDILFITGGEKDVLSLSSQGLNAICLNSETAHIPKNLLRGLSYRFKHITLLYDADETGKASDISSTKWLNAGSWNFNSPAQLPSQFALPVKEQTAVSTEKGTNSLLVDFGKETLGFIKLHGVKGKGKLSVYYGESKE